MRTLKFWKDEIDVIIDNEGNSATKTQWFCSDGISTYFANTKSEAAAHFGVPIGFDDVSVAASAMGRKGGSSKSERKTASSRENGKRGGRPTIDEFNEKFPICQDFHSGLWGWRRVNGCVDLSKCTFRSKSAAARDRNQSNEKAFFLKTGEICISL